MDYSTSKSERRRLGDCSVHERFQPMRWKLGRMLKTFSGPDNLIRVVLIKTVDGDIKRPISKVSPVLPEAEDV